MSDGCARGCNGTAALGHTGWCWKQQCDSMAHRLAAKTDALAASEARGAELTAALTLAERALQAEQEKYAHILSCEACQADDGWCPDALGHQIHADELRLAILAAAATPPAAAGGDEAWCTEDRHIVLASGEACVCGENRMELLL